MTSGCGRGRGQGRRHDFTLGCGSFGGGCGSYGATQTVGSKGPR